MTMVLATALSMSAYAQKDLKKMVRQADAQYKAGNYAAAWIWYRQALRVAPGNTKIPHKAAISWYELRYPADSLQLIAPSLRSSKSHDALYFTAVLAHKAGRFDEALDQLAEYGAIAESRRYFSNDETDRLLSNSANAKKITAAPTPAKIRNMGTEVNSRFADYAPVIMPDESELYFTSRRPTPTHTKLNGDNVFFEDVYVLSRKASSWSSPQNAGFPLNTETNDACVAISPDGQRMIVYRTAADIVSGDLYVSRLGDNDRWQPLELLSNEINSPFIETSACFSADTSEVFFSSDRPGGQGGKDIYRIKKLPNGKWSPPLNLGPTVNTKYDDDAPFLHPDGVTLYFSSKGHTAIGEYDVFRSVYNREQHEFGEAENLGFPINDVEDDIFFVLSADGQRGYYSSSRKGGAGGMDLYEIDTRFGANDLQVKTGRVLVGNSFGRAHITLFDRADGSLYGEYASHPSTGKFVFILNPSKAYDAVIEAKGYKAQQIVIDEEYLRKNDQIKFILSNDAEK